MHYKQLQRVISTLALGLICLVASAQHTVSGVVKDSQGAPLPGVSIIVEGTTQGTVSDFDGNYTLANVPESGKLQASFIGFTTQVIAIGNQTTIDFVLKDEAQELGEVVAVGYGTVKKSDLTGSVASVSTEKLVAKGATSVMENLQGSVPGVNITQSTGRTNGGFNIEIRGKSSINTDVTPIYVIDGVVCSDMDFLNPQDIERVDVLKDASSTAIYGSRATAGVIMITTKSGNAVKKNKDNDCQQKFNVSYDGYYGITNIARPAELMGAQEFYNYRFLRFLTPTENTAAGVANPRYGMTTAAYRQMSIYTADSESGESVLKRMIANGETYDWVDIVTETGKKQNHYISASGSTSDISYHLGVGYTNDKGLYKGDEMSKVNFKGSLDTDLGQYVSAGFNFNAAVTKTEYAPDNAISIAYRMNPFMIPYDENGEINRKPGSYVALGSDSQFQFSDQISPLYYYDLQTKERTTYRILGNAYVQIKPITGMSIKSTFSPSYTHYKQGQFDDKDEYTEDSTSTSTVTESTSTGFTWTNVLNYNKTFNSVHSVDLMGMAELSYGRTEKGTSVYTSVMNGTLWYNLGSGTYDTDSSSPSSYSESSMVSYALRANYSYNSKYMLTGTIRWDGSSKFADGNRWGAFPSVAAAWRVSEESFMENTKEVLSNLKLRVSYGVTGNNSGIDNYATQQTVSGPNYYNIGDVMNQAYYPSSIVNKELSWEKSHEINIGVDYGFLNNRISGVIDVYQKTSEDLLYDVTLPLPTGGVTMTTNIGKVQNRGIEASITGVIIDNEDWHWDVTATYAKNVNEVKEINGLGEDIPSDNLFIGKTVNNVYNYEWDGVVTDKDIVVPNNEIAVAKGFTPGQKVKSYDYYYNVYGWTEGMPIIRDINGDGSFDNDDKKVYSSDPKWTGSISSTLSWKGLDLSAMAYIKYGYTVSSPTYGGYINYGDRGWQKLDVDYYIPAGTLIDCDGVRSDGTYINPKYQQQTHYGKYPFPVNNNNSGVGSIWAGSNAKSSGCPNSITDASFVKIKNITLGYTLPKNILESIHMQKVRVYCTVTNPFCFSDYIGWDPEWANASLKNDGPSTITWEFGLNVKF